MELRIKKLDEGVPTPCHAKPGDAGLDLTITRGVNLRPMETKTAGTGIAVEIPEGHVGLVFPRSGLSSKRGVSLANCVGVVDSGYRGEIMVSLHNIGQRAAHVERGERVAQLVVVPFVSCECVEVDELSDSERGEGGFGSTGRFADGDGLLASALKRKG